MTEEEFLKRLAETPRDWEFLSGSVLIRRHDKSGGSYCPLSAVADIGHFTIALAAARLNMEVWEAQAIVGAADSAIHHNPRLRAELLKACGLSEKP